MNTIEYIDAIRKHHGWTSDYQLINNTEFTRSGISSYRTGRSEMDETACLYAAKLLNTNPALILLDVAAARTKNSKVAKILRQTAKQLASAAASLFLTLTMIYSTTSPTSAMASNALQGESYVYYVKWFYNMAFLAHSHPIVFFTLFLSIQLFFRYLLQLRNISDCR